LVRVAQRRVLDVRRREAVLRRRLPTLAASADTAAPAFPEPLEPAAVLDDRLRLVLTCCHPALAPEARIALTLRMVGGLTTEEIAAAFLVPVPTMAARITRAKRKVTAAAIPYRVPEGTELLDRVDSVLTVIHLVATTGHTAPSGPTVGRPDLEARALDLAQLLSVLLPDEPEVLGLLALLLLTAARQPARTGADGLPVLLADQDRSRWDADRLRRGLQVLAAAERRLGSAIPGRFLLQAGIAAVHAEARDAADTDWPAVVALYDRLQRCWPTPVVAMNRAAALAQRDGPAAGLALLDTLADDPILRRSPTLPAARAELLRRQGRAQEAADAYRLALAVVGNEADAAFLRRRLAALEPQTGTGLVASSPSSPEVTGTSAGAAGASRTSRA
jgi:RNA polymerase sigma-70 factor (ECF subfamily)